MSAVSLQTNRLPARTAHSRCSQIYWLEPIVVLDIEAGAGGNELLHHERVTVVCSVDERRAPAHEVGSRLGYRTAVAVGYIGPYPSLLLTSRPAPAAMSSITLVQPFAAPNMSAVYLSRKLAAASNREIHCSRHNGRFSEAKPFPAPSAITQRHTRQPRPSR